MSSIPKKHRAGISFSVTESLPDFPLPAWTVTLYLRGPSSHDIIAADVAGGHEFAVDDTSAWAAGKYVWQIVATLGTITEEVCTGEIIIEPSIAGMSAGTDQRDHLDKVIEDLEAIIEDRVKNGAVGSYSIQTERARSVQYEDLETLEKLLTKYRNDRARIRRVKSGQSPFKKYKARFTR